MALPGAGHGKIPTGAVLAFQPNFALSLCICPRQQLLAVAFPDQVSACMSCYASAAPLPPSALGVVPSERVSTISWSNLTGWFHFPFALKYFAAFSAVARPASAATQGEHLWSTLLITEKMSSSYWSEMSHSSCGTQQSQEILQCQPQHYHCYQSSLAQQAPEKNVVYERVRTYSGPMNKVVQALDPIGSRETLSPLKTSSSYQNLVWSDQSQVLQTVMPG
ncbi:Protein POF1B [Galemys pyrenaicus]|uniref:Protein POF1B n=1 Tax=Galemys pyrenaicus TaxID=202257 RepID=A0A8J6DN95_GALPY|nr:Protein POF1B [Galemys pyrenaicus]